MVLPGMTKKSDKLPFSLLQSNLLLKHLGGHVIDRVFLIAVSGGVDSMVLLYLMKESGLPVAAAHVNYGLRGEDSDADEALIRKICTSYGISLHVLNAKKEMQGIDVGIQEKARNIRYQWFEKLCKEHHYTDVLTAHHADDLIENFLMYAFRGSGTKGLIGMLSAGGNLIRPLMDCFKSEILAFASAYHIEYREDSSNCKEDYLRNYYRNHILPLIFERDHTGKKGIMHTLRTLDQLESVQDVWLKEIQQKYSSSHPAGSVFLLADFIRAYPDERLLFTLLHSFGLNASCQSEVAKALQQKTSGKIWHAETGNILLHRGNLIIEHILHSPVTIDWTDADTPVMVEGFTFSLIKNETGEGASANLWALLLDNEKVCFPLTIRNRKKDDYFYPEKGKGRVLISDYLTNLGMDRFLKERVLLLCKNEEVLAIPFYRNDKRNLSDKRKNTIHITIKKTQ
jgi:tRNA(Ile)-lysidine synthase